MYCALFMFFIFQIHSSYVLTFLGRNPKLIKYMFYKKLKKAAQKI